VEEIQRNFQQMQFSDAASKRAGVPTRQEIAERSRGSGEVGPSRNFVAENRAAAKALQSRTEEDAVGERLRKIHGQKISKDSASGVPEYLTKIQNELQAKKQAEFDAIAERQAASQIPQGFKLLSEEERVSTLDTLEKKMVEMEKAHRDLPLKIETEGQKLRQREIEGKLKELSKAIEMFKKPRVLVQMD